MRIFCMCAEEAVRHFEDYRDLLERFERETGESSAQQVRDGAGAETLQVWGLDDLQGRRLVAVTEISATPKGNVCTLRIGVSTDDVPVPYQERLLDEIGGWARSIQCVRVRIVGRRGWMRRFPRFKETAIVMDWTL